MAGLLLNTTTIPQPPHPFYPLEANVIGYLANKWSVLTLLGAFFAGCTVILGTTLALVRSKNPALPGREQAIVLWFILSGTIHFFFEGYFAWNHNSMPSKQDLFGQLWKEYAFSDSRYMTSDPFVLCMETITAVCWGPLSFCIALMITFEHPLRHPLQAMVSLGQLYGDILYYATSMFDLYHKGLNYCRPEPYYFWCYYFFMNFIWIVIPAILLYSSVSQSGKAFQELARSTSYKGANGSSKKRN